MKINVKTLRIICNGGFKRTDAPSGDRSRLYSRRNERARVKRLIDAHSK